MHLLDNWTAIQNKYNMILAFAVLWLSKIQIGLFNFRILKSVEASNVPYTL